MRQKVEVTIRMICEDAPCKTIERQIVTALHLMEVLDPGEVDVKATKYGEPEINEHNFAVPLPALHKKEKS